MKLSSILITILIYTLSSITIFAQDNKTYFEKIEDGFVQFYFDQNYYLVDKNCEFVNIERVSKFDVSKNQFIGPFEDYDLNGNLLLAGQYVNGKKDGVITAYHSNGNVKWECSFKDGKPYGLWKYYYPDNKPMLDITLYNDQIAITNLWDRNGKQTITDGNGVYEMTMPISSFTEHGYKFFKRKGKVSNGYPNEQWTIQFVGSKKDELIHACTEWYENGQLVEQEKVDAFDHVYINFNEFTMFPTEYSSRSELLMSKDCSFDANTGFNSFLADKFKHLFTSYEFEETDFELTFTAKVKVNKNGTPSKKVEIVNSSLELDKRKTIYLQNVIKSIYYYIPSINGDKTIDDNLSLTIQVNQIGDIVTIPPIVIKREFGI